MAQTVVLITGASKGIGLATARDLASRGCHVVATARDKSRLEKLAAHDPENISIYPCDLSEKTAVEAMVRFIADNGWKVSTLIHNAGALVRKPFAKLDDNDWQYMWEVNLMSAVRLLRLVLPLMPPKSHVVTIGSMGGIQGSVKFAGLSAYSTSKGALSVFTECMAEELKDQQISVNCLCPGAVQTEMFAEAFPGFQAPVDPDQMGHFISDFALTAHGLMNGRVIPVALGNP